MNKYFIKFGIPHREHGLPRARGATLKVGRLDSDSKWGAENIFFSVTL